MTDSELLQRAQNYFDDPAPEETDTELPDEPAPKKTTAVDTTN